MKNSIFVIEMDILNKFLPRLCLLAIAPFSFAQDNINGEASHPVSEEIAAPAEPAPVEAVPAPQAEPVYEPPAMPVPAPAPVTTVPVAEPAPAPVAVLVAAPVATEVTPPGSGFPISFALRISGGLSGFYGHERVNNLYLRPSYSYGGGIVIIVPLIDELLSLDPAVQYSYGRTHTEWSKEDPFGEKVRKATVSNHTLEVPVLFRLDLGGLFMEIGPQFNFILSSTTETEKSSIFGGKEKYDTPDLNLFVFGGAAGIGYNIAKIFSIDIRGQYGFFEYAEDTYGKPWIVHLGLSFRVL